MNQVYNYVTERIIEELEKGVIPWQKTWLCSKINYVSRRSYSGCNLLLLPKQGEYLTWNQIQDLEGKVKKGTDSHMVIFWKMIKKSKLENTDDQEDKDNDKIPLLRYYNVFHIDDIEGVESKIDYNKDNKDSHQQAEDIISNYSDVPNISYKKSTKAYYHPNDDKIVCPKKIQFNNKDMYYKTLFHELIHSTGHWNRLKRYNKDNDYSVFSSDSYSREELVAEIGASMLIAISGLSLEDTIEDTSSYIDGWLKHLNNDRTLIVQAAGRAQKAVSFITEGLDFNNINQYHNYNNKNNQQVKKAS